MHGSSALLLSQLITTAGCRQTELLGSDIARRAKSFPNVPGIPNCWQKTLRR